MSSEEGSSSISLEVSRAILIDKYREIEEKAVRHIRAGDTEDNYLLTGEKEDNRYSITAISLISGPADAFINSVVVPSVENADASVQWVPNGFRHITLRDLNFNKDGRRATNIDAIAARRYFEAVRKSFEKPYGSAKVELVKIIPTIDKDQNSVSIVAAFLPIDTKIVDIRQKLGKSVKDAGLLQEGREGGDIIFSTLGRFPHHPLGKGDSVPLLEALNRINEQISSKCYATINDVDLLSTAPGKWISVERHVYLIPPISLVQENPPAQTHFVRPAHRRMLNSIE